MTNAHETISGEKMREERGDQMLSRFRLLVLCVALSACTGKDATAPMSVASVLVSVPSHTFYVGASVQATVAVTDQSGNAISGQAVSWSTSDPTIATVSQSGLMTGTGAGFATITASVGTHQGTAALTVTLVPVASVLVTPATSALLVGQTQQLTAAAHDSAGNILSNRTITWSTSDSTKARVSSTGLVTAVAAGSVSITATIGTQLGPFAQGGEGEISHSEFARRLVTGENFRRQAIATQSLEKR